MIEYKGYGIDSDGTFGNFIIKSIGKGAIPKKLRGSYTNTFLAKRDIDFHGKEKVNDEANPTR